MDSSQVEVLPAGASELERFVDAMMDEHLGVMVEIVGLERESVGVVGAGRAGAVVGRVVFDLCAVRDAAASVVLDATKSDLGPLFEPGAPLGVYLTGLLMWSRGVARAMRRLARSTADGKPAWLPTRRRLDAAKGTYLVGLEDDALDPSATQSATAVLDKISGAALIRARQQQARVQFLAPNLLRRQIGWRSHRCAGTSEGGIRKRDTLCNSVSRLGETLLCFQELCHTKVENLDFATVRNKDVCRFYIPMNDAMVMRHFQTVCNLNG